MPREGLLALLGAQAELLGELGAELAAEKRRGEEQARLIEELTAKIVDLERRSSRNSRNSSLSPSTDDVIPGRAAPEPGAGEASGARKTSGAGRKRGGQPGADGLTLA